MDASRYLVFGDLHGRILPAFRLATVWAKEHDPLAGILQVGDLGYFPNPAKLDKATVRHAKDDPLELGVFDVVQPTELADAIFDACSCPSALWFTAGNHEDFDELEQLGRTTSESHYPVDAYGFVRCIRDGAVADLSGGIRVGAAWGVDGQGANRRTNLPPRGYIRERSIDQLLSSSFDVLLSHDAPRDAKRVGYGSELLASLIELAKPAFAFFGHYRGDGSESLVDYGPTRVYHMAGFELRERDGTPEPGSVGLLTWFGDRGEFDFLPSEWLKTFSRHNWKWR